MRIIDGKDEYQLNSSESQKVRELLTTFEQEKSNDYYDKILNKAIEDKRKQHQPQQQKTPQKLPQDFRGIVHI